MFTIFTKVKFVFFPPKNVDAKPVVTTPKGFTENVPDWVKKDRMFKLGVESGEISVMSSKEKILRTEAALANNEDTIPVVPDKEEAPAEESEPEEEEPKPVPKVTAKVKKTTKTSK